MITSFHSGDSLLSHRKVFLSIGPLVAISWLTLAFVDPDPPGESTIRLGYFIGSLFAHATLAAAWSAFGPGVWQLRMPLSILWVLSLPVAIAINIGIYGGPDEAILWLGACYVGQWLVLQFPLGSMAWGLGMHLAAGDTGNPASSQRQQLRFGIRHLMIVMVITSVVFGVGRIVVPLISFSGRGEGPTFVFLAVAAVIVTLPLLLAALMRRLTVVGILLSIVLIVVLTALELPLMKSVGARGPDTGHFIAINVSSGLLVLVVAGVARLNGYSLCARRGEVAT